MPIVFVIASTLSLLIACTSPEHKSDYHHHHEHKHKHHHGKKGINDKYLSKDLNAEKYNQRFEGKRDVFVKRQKLIEAMDIRSGQAVADIGAGTGSFIPMMADKVGGKGKIYAVEIAPNFIDYMTKRFSGDQRVEIVKGEFETTNLKSNSVHSAVLINVYHHLDNPPAMLKDFRRILKPGGKLFVVDFDRKGGKARKWIVNHVAQEKAGYIKQIKESGFAFIKDHPVDLEENFMIEFKKK